jgi:diguanylate cyclase (GGDEF)-like protein
MKHLSTSRRAAIFVTLICVLILVLDGWRSVSVYRVRSAEMRHLADGLARIAAQQAEDELQVSDLALQIVAAEATHGVGAETPALVALMKMELATVPQIQGMLIFDANGDLRATTYPGRHHAVNAADRPSFIYHRDHVDSGIHISEPIFSRTVKQWVLPVSIRYNRPDGSFGGIVVTDIDLRYLQQFYERTIPGTNGVVTLYAGDGLALMRWPYSTRDAVDTAETTTVSTVSNAVMAWQTQATELDGIERLSSFRRLDRYPVIVRVGIATDEAFALWRLDTALHMLAGVLMVLLIGGYGSRVILARARAEQTLLRANRSLEKLALHDGLTGVANRRQFDEALTSEYDRAWRQDDPLALIMLDVDHFKQYNDHYGHVAGDECLKRIAQTLREVTARRPGDLLARYGGEEFVVLLPNTDYAGAMIVAENICVAVGALGIEHVMNPARIVTVSAGVDARQSVRETSDYSEMLSTADNALYAAKQAGRNCVRYGAGSAGVTCTAQRPSNMVATPASASESAIPEHNTARFKAK